MDIPGIHEGLEDLGLLTVEEGIDYYFEVSVPKDDDDTYFEFLLVKGDIVEGQITQVKRWPLDERADRMSVERIKILKMKERKKQ